MAFMALDEDTLGFVSSNNCWAGVNSLGDANPVVRVIVILRRGRGRWLLACPVRRWSRVLVFMTGLSLELRDSCVVSTLWQRQGSRRSRVQGCHC